MAHELTKFESDKFHKSAIWYNDANETKDMPLPAMLPRAWKEEQHIYDFIPYSMKSEDNVTVSLGKTLDSYTKKWVFEDHRRQELVSPKLPHY